MIATGSSGLPEPGWKGCGGKGVGLAVGKGVGKEVGGTGRVNTWQASKTTSKTRLEGTILQRNLNILKPHLGRQKGRLFSTSSQPVQFYGEIFQLLGKALDVFLGWDLAFL